MAVESGVGAVLLLVGRLLFGGVLAFAGLNHFLNGEEMSEYATAKGVPAPGFGVAASGAMLVLGGVGILLGAYPVIAAGMIATFFIVVTPMMHDFWAAPEAEVEDELTNFLKNAELLGAALVFLALGDLSWGFALGIGLF
jgi:uncharacterized membrane protein YphA (DoxX/SURF4 family)